MSPSGSVLDETGSGDFRRFCRFCVFGWVGGGGLVCYITRNSRMQNPIHFLSLQPMQTGEIGSLSFS